MTTVNLGSPPVWTFLANNGQPMVGGQLFSYLAGTSTPAPTYIDSTGITQNSNPIILNSRGDTANAQGGSCGVWWPPGTAYKFILQDPLGNVIWSQDNLLPALTSYTIPVGTVTDAMLAPSSVIYAIDQTYFRTAAEIAAGVTPTNFGYAAGNVLRYGIVPNSSGAAAANTTALQALLLPSVTGPVGTIVFPNTTGADIYYFNGNIGVRDNVALDLQGCTLKFAITGASTDNACGCFTAQRNFKIENGSLVWNFTTGSATSNYGNGLMFGGRGTDVSLFPAFYDSLAASPLGTITVRNMILNGTAAGSQGRGILMFGGLVNCQFENVTIEGNASLLGGIYYEFGYATNPAAASSRQSSHAHNIEFKDIKVNNCSTGAGIEMRGAYSVTVQGLQVDNTPSLASFSPGEARYYRPWNPVDLAGAKHALSLRNIVGTPTTGAGIIVSGSNTTISGGYLGQAWVALTAYIAGQTVFANTNLYVVHTPGTSGNTGGPTGTGTNIADGAGSVTWDYVSKEASVDLLDATIDNCVIAGNVNNYGINISGATNAVLRNCSITGAQRGIVTSQDTTRWSFENCTVLNSTGIGINIGQAAVGVYTTARQSVGYIRGCFVAGSGTSGASSAISVNTTIACTIEDCRFGYEAIHDDTTETTQLFAVTVAADAFNVIVRNCYVAGVSSGNAFNLAAASSSARGCRLQSIQGLQTTQGKWLTDFQSATAVVTAGSGTIATDGLSTSRVAPAGAVTGVILGAGGFQDQEVTVVNESAAGNTITFAASGTSNVADGTGDVIAGLTARKFKWDTATTLWYPIK